MTHGANASGKAFDEFKGNILVTDSGKYQMENRTIIFARDGSKADAEWKAFKWADMTERKIKGTNPVVHVEVDAKDKATTPAALIVVVTNGYVETTAKTDYGVVTDRRENSAGDIYITVDNGKEVKEYKANNDAAKKEDIVNRAVKIETNNAGDTAKVVDQGEVGDLIVPITGSLYEIKDEGNYRRATDFFIRNGHLYDSEAKTKTNRVSYILDDTDRIRVLNYLRVGELVETDTNLDGEVVVFEGVESYARNQIILNGKVVDASADVVDFFYINNRLNERTLMNQKLTVKQTNSGRVYAISGIELDDTAKNRTIDGYGMIVDGNIVVKAENVTLKDLTAKTIYKNATTLNLEDVIADEVIVKVGGGTTLNLRGTTEVTTLTLDVKDKVDFSGSAKVATLKANAKGIELVNADATKVEKVVTTEETAETLKGLNDIPVKDSSSKDITVEALAVKDDGKKVTVTGDVYTVVIEMNRGIEVADLPEGETLKDQITATTQPTEGVKLNVDSVKVDGTKITIVLKVDTWSAQPTPITGFTVTVKENTVKDLAGNSYASVITVNESNIE